MYKFTNKRSYIKIHKNLEYFSLYWRKFLKGILNCAIIPWKMHLLSCKRSGEDFFPICITKVRMVKPNFSTKFLSREFYMGKKTTKCWDFLLFFKYLETRCRNEFYSLLTTILSKTNFSTTFSAQFSLKYVILVLFSNVLLFLK